MCLETIKKNQPKEKSGFGYKCVMMYSKTIETLNQYYKVHPRNWNRDDASQGYMLHTDGAEKASYQSGFHIWMSKRAARQWVVNCYRNGGKIIKVEYKGLICMGTQDHHNVAVARQFRIVKEN